MYMYKKNETIYNWYKIMDFGESNLQCFLNGLHEKNFTFSHESNVNLEFAQLDIELMNYVH